MTNLCKGDTLSNNEMNENLMCFVSLECGCTREYMRYSPSKDSKTLLDFAAMISAFGLLFPAREQLNWTKRF